jgi:glucose/arabinose dehydrogenase
MKRWAASLGTGLLTLAIAAPAGAQVPELDPVNVPGSTFTQDIEIEVLTTATQDPTDIAVTSDGRVIWTEREGKVKVLLPDGTQVDAGHLPVSANECDNCVAPDSPALNEGGLHGLLLAKDFDESGRIYLRYSVPGSMDPNTGEGIFRLSTFVLDDSNVLDLDSEQVIFENPAEWNQCCHYGGDLDWMPDGTIVMSMADDTNPFESNGYAPIDERPGREAFNAQRTSQNPADTRGKVLRFMPDGSVPDGTQPGVAPNPHVGDPAFNPYVYAMGFRSDYRISVDPDSGAVYVGNVGPDAGSANAARGPQGFDELDVIPPGGGTNHGWPYCIGPNIPYIDYDFESTTSGDPFSCDGFTPPAIYYPGAASAEWPQLGSGGRTAMVGNVYDYEGDGALRLPDRFQDQLFFFEWSRNRIFTLPVGGDGVLDTTKLLREIPYSDTVPRVDTAAGGVESPVTLRQAGTINHPHDTAIGPDGAVYLVEYGTAFWNNTNSRISRITCADCEPNPADYGLTALGGSSKPQGPGTTSAPVPAPRSSVTWVLAAALAASAATFGLTRRRGGVG